MATRLARLRFAEDNSDRKHPEAGVAVAPGGGMMMVDQGRYGEVRCGAVRYGEAGQVRFGMVRFGQVRYGSVW